jgi:hypothetical protein
MAIVRLAKRAHLLHDVADVVNGSHDLSIIKGARNKQKYKRSALIDASFES